MRAQEEETTQEVDVADLVGALTVTPTGEPDHFAAGATDWWRGERVFGGMVVAQALQAAQATVPDGVPLHSLHGYFLRPVRPVRPGAPVDLAVDRVRDGRSFATRSVRSEADGRHVFQLTCSFHRPEEGETYQLPAPAVPPPEDIDPEDIPIPFDVREMGSTPRRPDGTFTATRRVWFRTRQGLPDDPKLHAAVLAYLSDMTGAAFRPHNLGVWGTHTDASLDHAFWLHRPARADQWLLYDLQALVNEGGRATVRGLLYDRQGVLVASMAQELLIRPLDEPVRQVHPAWAAGRLEHPE